MNYVHFVSGFLQDVVNHVCYYGSTWDCHPTSTMVLKTWLMRYSGVQNINCPFISAGTHIVLTFINLTYSSNITADFFTGHKYITELTYWNIHQWAPTLKPDLALPTSCKTCHHVCHPLICKPPFSTIVELHTSCFTNYMPFRNCH